MIINKKCEHYMKEMIENNQKINLILTSPPYNTSRKTKYSEYKGKPSYMVRYDEYQDHMDDETYMKWTAHLFELFNQVLEENGVILYNISYSSEKPTLMYDIVNVINTQTEFMVADTIYWKKRNALPNNLSPNKVTRIIEPVFVICRKSELKTFQMNKKVVSLRKTGQRNFENIYNFVEAKNNDGQTKLNLATFSSDLCMKLLNMYAVEGTKVYDPFLGTGTTGVACEILGFEWLGTEISPKQCEYGEKRIKKIREELDAQLKLDL